MSQEARDALVQKLVFQADSQRSDLENIDLTQTQLIALLTELTNRGWNIEITSVRTDHSDDSALGYHCHAHGFCADLWPLESMSPGDYVDGNSAQFAEFLKDCSESKWLYQIGLAGSAWTDANAAAAGPTVFHDDGADHIHLGAQ